MKKTIRLLRLRRSRPFVEDWRVKVLLGWRVKTWFGRRVSALKAYVGRVVRLLKKIWRVLRSIPFLVLLLLLLAEVVLRVRFDLGLTLWVESLWKLKGPDGVYYLRASLITAGAAFVAAGFFAWRNITADKQLKNAQLSLQEERYTKGVELLAHESQVIRIGGLYALHQLAEDFSEKWALPVLELMCIFVRTPPLSKEKAEEISDQDKAEGSGKKKSLRRDVQEAVQLLGTRGLARREEEKREQGKSKEGRKGKSPGSGKLDFYGGDLAGGSWRGVDLEKANFSGTTLDGADFYGATLTEADFYGATLTEAHFEKATLTGAQFWKATLTDAKFHGATLTDAQFEEATLTDAQFYGATLTGASFGGATLTKTRFSEATLTDAQFEASKGTEVNFSGATLTKALFLEATLTKANFSGAMLTEAQFYESTLTDANFVGADITGADLTYVNLSGVTLLTRRISSTGKREINSVKGAIRKQLEAGWIEPGRPLLKIEEKTESDADGLWRETRTKMPLTEVDWKILGLDVPPTFKVVGPPEEGAR